MSRVWSLRFAFVLLLALAASGCQRGSSPERQAAPARELSASGFPLRVQDDMGRLVVVPAEPKRIVCLLPSFTETVFALGLGERVIAVDDYSDYPPEVRRLPKLGGMYDTQVERALSLKPDLVLMPEGGATVWSLARGGAPVWAGSARKFEDVFRVIEETGKLVGRAREARELATRIRADIAAVEASVQAQPPVSVYYELDSTPYSVGPASFIGVLLAKAGGKNIVPAALGDFPKLNPELIVASDPAVIIGASLDEIARRPGFRGLSAVKNRRVFNWSPEEAHLLARPGPRLAEGVRALARYLHQPP
jgi:iron complex transport system substrate-binding protein